MTCTGKYPIPTTDSANQPPQSKAQPERQPDTPNTPARLRRTGPAPAPSRIQRRCCHARHTTTAKLQVNTPQPACASGASAPTGMNE